MTGLEPAVLIALNVLGTTVLGVSIKDALPSMVNIGWKCWGFYKQSKYIDKLAKMLITYTLGYYPDKEQRNVLKATLHKAFKKADTSEVVVLVEFYKEIKDLLNVVKFDDLYWEEHKYKLIIDGEAMRKYLVKKVYVDRLYEIFITKLFNNPIEEVEKNKFKEELIEAYMDDKISYRSMEIFIENLEEELKVQYGKNKERYEDDFGFEKINLQDIVKRSMVGLDRKTRRLTEATVIDILEECKNVDISTMEEPSAFIVRTNSLSKGSISPIDDIIEETLKPNLMRLQPQDDVLQQKRLEMIRRKQQVKNAQRKRAPGGMG